MNLLYEFFGDPLKHAERERKAQQVKKAQSLRKASRLSTARASLPGASGSEWPGSSEEVTLRVTQINARLLYKLAALITMNVVAWILWKPLGAYLTVMSVGYLRLPFQRRALFWSQTGAVIFGLLLGVGFAVVVWTLAHLVVQSFWARLALGLWGFLASSYLGGGVSPNPHLRAPGQEKIAEAAFIAQLAYLAATLLIVIWPSVCQLL